MERKIVWNHWENLAGGQGRGRSGDAAVMGLRGINREDLHLQVRPSMNSTEPSDETATVPKHLSKTTEWQQSQSRIVRRS